MMKIIFSAITFMLMGQAAFTSLTDDLKQLEDDIAKLTEKREKEATQNKKLIHNDASQTIESDETKITNGTPQSDESDKEISLALKELDEANLLYSLAKQGETDDPQTKSLIEMSLEDALSKMTTGSLSDVESDFPWDEANEKKDVKCKDLRPGNCKILAARNFCTHKKYAVTMQKMCLKSCKFCKAPEVPKCQSTPFGCCGDHKTTRSDETGSNCPACENAYDRLCMVFKSWCNKPGLPAGQFLIDHCPQTCNRCKKCEDHPTYSFYCGFWKEKLGWCGNPNSTKDMKKDKMKVMKMYCQKSCGYC